MTELPKEYIFEDWRFDRRNGVIVTEKDSELLLGNEPAVLDFLVQHPGHFFAPEAIVAGAWPKDAQVSPNSAQKAIEGLRKRFRHLGLNGQKIIKTQKGRGYCFTPFPLEKRVTTRVSPKIDEHLILAIAQDYGFNGDLLLSRVLKLKEEKSRKDQLREFKIHQRKIRSENINTKLLKLYYKDSALAEKRYSRYAVRVADTTILTNIIAAESGIDIKMNLEATRANFAFVGHQNTSGMRPSEDHLTEYLADAWINGIYVYNDPVLCLHSYNPYNTTAPTTFTLNRYLDYRLSYGSLGNELTVALSEADFKPEVVMTRREHLLKKRNDLLPTPDAILDCKSRIAVGGINVVFALRRVDSEEGHNDFMFYLAQRSSAVAFAQEEPSIIPSGFHSVPVLNGVIQSEVSPWQSVYRELGEELFERDEAIVSRGKIDFNPQSEDCEPVHWFRKNPGEFIHELVSFGFDIIDGSYQFCILLIVDDPQYWKDYGGRAKPNYEYNNPGVIATPISSKNCDKITEILTNPMCAHTSIFTLIPALQRLSKFDETKVILPEIEVLSKW